jgi:hypothetical protein
VVVVVMLEKKLCIQQRGTFIVADTPPSHRDVKLMQTFVKIPVSSKAGLLSHLRVTLLGTVSGVCASKGASRLSREVGGRCAGLTIITPQKLPTPNHVHKVFILPNNNSAMVA